MERDNRERSLENSALNSLSQSFLTPRGSLRRSDVSEEIYVLRRQNERLKEDLQYKLDELQSLNVCLNVKEEELKNMIKLEKRNSVDLQDDPDELIGMTIDEKEQKCCRYRRCDDCWPIFIDMIYDQVRSRFLAFLTMIVLVLITYKITLLGSGETCQSIRTLDNPKCALGVNNTYELTQANQLATVAAVQHVFFFLAVLVAFLANSKYSCMGWTIPALTFCGVGLFLGYPADFAACDLDPLEPQPALSGLYQSPLCMGRDMKAFLPKTISIVIDGVPTSMFDPCEGAALAQCEALMHNTPYLSTAAVMNVLTLVLYVAMTVVLFVTAFTRLFGCCQSKRPCGPVIPRFSLGPCRKRASRCVKSCVKCCRRTMKKAINDKDDTVTTKKEEDLELDYNEAKRKKIFEEFSWPLRMWIGLALNFVMHLVVFLYAYFAMESIIDWVIRFKPTDDLKNHSGIVRDLWEFVEASIYYIRISFFVSGAVSNIFSLFAVFQSFLVFREAAVEIMLDRGQQALLKNVSYSSLLLDWERAPLYGVSRLIGFWIGSVIAATIIIWGSLFLIMIGTIAFAKSHGVRQILFRGSERPITLVGLPMFLEGAFGAFASGYKFAESRYRILLPRLFYLVDFIKNIVSALTGPFLSIFRVGVAAVYLLGHMQRVDRHIFPRPDSFYDLTYESYCATIYAYVHKVKWEDMHMTKQKPGANSAKGKALGGNDKNNVNDDVKLAMSSTSPADEDRDAPASFVSEYSRGPRSEDLSSRDTDYTQDS